MDNQELVLKTLKEASEPLKGKEIAEAAGLEKKDVDKAIKILKETNLINSPKRCFYAAN